MRRIGLLAATLAAIATPALAHVGAHPENGFLAGVSHPLSGLDHLLAMLAVGLWAGLASPRAPWLWPAAFVGFMLAGFAAGAGGLAIGAVETVILASVIALGLAAAMSLRVPAMAGVAIVAVFALAHGYAHGQELPAGASGLSFAAGFTLATAALHLAGLALAMAATGLRKPTLARAAGLGVAASGLALAWVG